jgi:anti-sigma factor RsiW
MKPCARNRKLIAWLVMDALDVKAAGELRHHIESCAQCQKYRQELLSIRGKFRRTADTLPEVNTSPGFHQQLVRRIQEESAAPSVRSRLVWSSLFNWQRWAVAAGLVLIAGMALFTAHRFRGGSEKAYHANAASLKLPVEVRAPTLSAYRLAANNSFEALDELLLEQVELNSISEEVVTVSAVIKSGLVD